MITHAPLHPLEHTAATEAHDQPTAKLDIASIEPTLASVSMLDHRTRSRAVRPRLAARGRYLAFEDGDETLLVGLRSNITHVGRGIGSHLRIDEQRVSRNHAIIVRHGRFARVLDNRSANGTFVNGRRVLATNIYDGDVIRIGPVAMQYVEIE
jgi:FHA domain-containing protein